MVGLCQGRAGTDRDSFVEARLGLALVALEVENVAACKKFASHDAGASVMALVIAACACGRPSSAEIQPYTRRIP